MKNVVLIVVDQLRADIAYHEYFPFVQTPNLDRLRSEGATLQNAFCQYPVCAPSRSSLVTGRYPQQHGVLTNRSMLPDTERTMAHHFADHGYDVVAVGKTHGQNPGFRRVPEPMPLERTLGSSLWGFYYSQDMLQEAPPADADVRPVLGVFEGDPSSHYDHQVNRHVRKYLDERDPQRPFCLWVGFHSPHPPLYPPRHLADRYPPDQIELPASVSDPPATPSQGRLGSEWRRTPPDTQKAMIAAYLALTAHMDECVGELLDVLRERGVLDDTVIVFLSDHGEQLGDHAIIGKWHNFYEGSLRVPVVFWTADGALAGTTFDTLFELVDVYPTLCDLAGIAVPQDVTGRSFAPTLADPNRAHREYAVSMFIEKGAHTATAPGGGIQQYQRGYMVRTARWKLAVYPGEGGELYDLDSDPGERDNLFGKAECREIERDLTRMMVEHLLMETRSPTLWGYNHFPG